MLHFYLVKAFIQFNTIVTPYEGELVGYKCLYPSAKWGNTTHRSFIIWMVAHLSTSDRWSGLFETSRLATPWPLCHVVSKKILMILWTSCTVSYLNNDLLIIDYNLMFVYQHEYCIVSAKDEIS